MRIPPSLKTLCASCAPTALLHGVHFMAVPVLMVAAPAVATTIVNGLSGPFALAGLTFASGVMGGLMQQFMDRASPSAGRALLATGASGALTYGIGHVLPQYEVMQMCQSIALRLQ